MPGATPKYAFPYPLGTDPVSDGDDQIKALAEKVEAVTGPVGSSLTYVGPGANDVFEGSRVFKSGGLVVVRVAMHTAAAYGAGVAWGQLPAGTFPGGTFRTVCWDQTAGAWATGSFVPATVTSLGGLYFEVAMPFNHNLVGTFVYPLA